MHIVHERHLLSKLRRGDERAFVAIYDRYKDALSVRLLYLLKSEALAEEALQDLFLRVWNLRATIDPDKSFKAYLYRIAESIAYDIFRKARRERRLFDELAAASSGGYTHIEEAIIDSENRSLLETLLQRLPARRREIFVACKLEGKSYKEVAVEYGISTTTVNDHVQKATRYLRTLGHSRAGIALFILTTCLLADY